MVDYQRRGRYHKTGMVELRGVARKKQHAWGTFVGSELLSLFHFDKLLS